MVRYGPAVRQLRLPMVVTTQVQSAWSGEAPRAARVLTSAAANASPIPGTHASTAWLAVLTLMRPLV